MLRGQIGGAASWQTVHSGSSYCSRSELILTFGVEKVTEAETVEILWPSGQRITLQNLAANHNYMIEEGSRILASRPFKR